MMTGERMLRQRFPPFGGQAGQGQARAMFVNNVGYGYRDPWQSLKEHHLQMQKSLLKREETGIHLSPPRGPSI